MEYIFSFEKYCKLENLGKGYESVLEEYDGWVVYPYDDKPGYGELCGNLVKLDWCIVEYNHY